MVQRVDGDKTDSETLTKGVPNTEAASAVPWSGPHLAFLDGLRGLAAFYVVVHHVYYIERDKSGYKEALNPMLKHFIHWLNFGEVAVAVFIVLSGYVLMLPVLRANGEIKGGLGRFFLRRARRILPPYYALLAISMVLIAFVPGMERINCITWDGPPNDNLSRMNVISHYLMFHNIRFEWKFGIVPPAWSIATEWWIYFFFALLLLPLRRRVGMAVTVALTFAATFLPHFLTERFMGRPIGDEARPWFVALFTFGMAACELHSNENVRTKLKSVWMPLALFFFGCYSAIAYFNEPWLWENVHVTDTLIGLATACFIVYCANAASAAAQSNAAKPLALRFLESKPLVSLGYFSYSLYLTHFAVHWFFHANLSRRMDASVELKLLVMMVVSVPLAVLAGYVIHRLFERPFLSK